MTTLAVPIFVEILLISKPFSKPISPVTVLRNVKLENSSFSGIYSPKGTKCILW